MRAGRPRRDVLVRLALTGPEPRVDVGADHGRVAERIGAIATEVQTDHARRAGIPWVVADGLDCFREVGTAVVAGMGARTIGSILGRAPPVRRAVLHAQDDPPRLRRWLAAHGWRIVDEALAPEARRYAEVVVAEPGDETASGLDLEYGPILLTGVDPLARAHFTQLVGHLERLVARSAPAPEVAAEHARRLAFVLSALERLGRPRDT